MATVLTDLLLNDFGVSLTLPTSVKTRCMRVEGWDEIFADKALVGFQQFAKLAHQLDDYSGTALIASPVVAAVWRQHVLDTVRYDFSCRDYCGGKFIHYDPENQLGGSNVNYLADRVNTTKIALKSLFGRFVDPTVWSFDGYDNIKENDEAINVGGNKTPFTTASSVQVGASKTKAPTRTTSTSPRLGKNDGKVGSSKTKASTRMGSPTTLVGKKEHEGFVAQFEAATEHRKEDEDDHLTTLLSTSTILNGNKDTATMKTKNAKKNVEDIKDLDENGKGAEEPSCAASPPSSTDGRKNSDPLGVASRTTASKKMDHCVEEKKTRDGTPPTPPKISNPSAAKKEKESPRLRLPKVKHLVDGLKRKKSSTPRPGQLRIKIRHHNEKDVCMQMRATSKLEKCFKTFNRVERAKEGDFKFVFQGKEIYPEQTPHDLEMVDLDMINAVRVHA